MTGGALLPSVSGDILSHKRSTLTGHLDMLSLLPEGVRADREGADEDGAVVGRRGGGEVGGEGRGPGGQGYELKFNLSS